jgi:hypothetical protein
LDLLLDSFRHLYSHVCLWFIAMNALITSPLPVSDFIQFRTEELPNGVTLHHAPDGIYIYVEHTYYDAQMVVSYVQLPVKEILAPNRWGQHDIVFLRIGPFDTLEGARVNIDNYSLASDVKSAEEYAAYPDRLSWMQCGG